MAGLNISSYLYSSRTKTAPVWRMILRAFLVLMLTLLLISAVSCDETSSSDNGGGNGGGDMSGGDDMGGGGASIVEPGGTLPGEPETFAYVAGGSARQTLDFYGITGLTSQTEASRGLAGSSGRPALVWFHGGGWVINDKTNIEPIAFEIAELAGFHLVSVGYRLAGPAGSQDPWPGMIHEVKSAIRWLKLNSETLGINPDYIITTGESAGAHLASMIALSAGVSELEGAVNPGATSDVAGGVLFYGPYEFDTIVNQGLGLVLDLTCTVDTLNPLAVWALLDCPIPDNVLEPLSGCNGMDIMEASPVTHVDVTDPPVFAASGTDDCFVPFQQVFDLQNALNGAGVSNEISVTMGGEHDVETLNVTAQQVVDFLDENVGK
jgi:acetyl esterase/lipase